MARKPLSESEINAKMHAFPEWEIRNGALYRELKFDSFSSAFGFMTQAALVSEKLDHHPNWSNVYNRVTIELSTHDANGITDIDFEWIARVTSILSTNI